MIAGLLLLAAAAQAGQNCGDLPQQPMNMCLLEAFQRDDAELNAQWKLTIEALKEMDADVDRTYDKDPGYVETLRAGQRAWLAWRDQQCLLESFAMRGGSGAPAVHSGCMSRMTRERTKQLKEMAEGGE